MPAVRPIDEVAAARTIEIVETVGDVGGSMGVDELKEHANTVAMCVVYELSNGGEGTGRGVRQRHVGA